MAGRVFGVAFAAFALALSCGFPHPDRVPGDSPLSDSLTRDSPMSDSPMNDSPSASSDFTGGITVAGGILTAGEVAVVDDGLETADWSCAGSICVSGGVTP